MVRVSKVIFSTLNEVQPILIGGIIFVDVYFLILIGVVICLLEKIMLIICQFSIRLTA